MRHIPDIVEWSAGRDMNHRPWLVLGKGPSYAKIKNIDTDGFSLLALNHVVRERPVEVAHAIDLDVVQDCADAIWRNAGTLIMPLHPHVEHSASARTIHELADEVPILGRMADAGRLAWYNASTWKRPQAGSPVIEVKFFSAEAAIAMLATTGAKVIRSLGVDGGSQYATSFSDLNESTRLANGHASFDRQFEGIASTIRKTGVFYAPLTVNAPVRVFVGTDRAQMIGVKMLEFSIKKYASLSVTVEPIDDASVPVPADPANRSRTGFSFSRFRIPELCGYKGRGIYMDADMQVFTDISDLWNRKFEGASVLYANGPETEGKDGKIRIPQFSVLLLDCASLDWDIRKIIQGFDEERYGYADLMQRICISPPDALRAGLPFEWNSLEHYEAGRTKLIHYTDMPTQPWVSKSNKNGELFYTAVREALAERFISADMIYEEILLGHLSPDFAEWVGLPSHPHVDRMRKEWKPPYQRFVGMPKVAQSGKAG
ncbi:MAG: hypothetical protein ACREO0_01855 [Pseudoxanthomonas sp.]